ncbi:MAG: choice-of-anchor D domain-containing protein, partial [Nitrospirota bacterium]|nr:choice-of-anchor D domain-containing protein [Nitrospirota bacterium]
PITINGGASQTFTVAFRPATAGGKSATISITSTAGNASVSATGTGVAVVTNPVLSVSPASLTFSNVTVGSTATLTATITNTGNAPLNIVNITSAGSAAFGFSPVSVAPVAAGASAALSVTYSPAAVGSDTGSIDITSDGGNATIGLSGTATAVSAGDVGLVKLTVPAEIRSWVNSRREIDVLAYAFATVDDTSATVVLTAAAAEGVSVRIDDASESEKMDADQQKKFDYEVKILCTKRGTWPITWAANISAAPNSEPSNDILTGTTQVVCSGDSREEDKESDARRKLFRYRED